MTRRASWLVVLAGLAGLLTFRQASSQPSARWTERGVVVQAEGLVWRSTSRISPAQARSGRFPVARLQARQGQVLDAWAPDGVTLHYLTNAGAVSVTTPRRPLPALRSPRLLVDKSRYVLEVQDGGRVVKRYPIALGANPVKRKLCFDRASTPEGRYRIVGVQPQATYYKAYDLDYPNAIDRERYRFAERHGLLPPGQPDIGGEIQIHGCGQASNWTWGCIALRDEDMRELFSHPEIGYGAEVLITGAELSLADLQAIARAPREILARRGLGSPESLGGFQMQRGLPVTCEPDLRTLRLLGL